MGDVGTAGHLVPELIKLVAMLGLSTLFYGHVLKGVPVSKIGESTGGGRMSKTFGYDNLRGQMPTIYNAMSSLIIFRLMTLLVGTMCSALIGFIAVFYYLRSPPVSWPGGPRTGKAKITRHPQWKRNKWRLGDVFQADGRICTFLSDDDGHAATEEAFRVGKDENEKILSGVAAGRQTWEMLSMDRAPDAEAMAQETYPFDPSQNPNSADLIFRKQQIAKWERNGGTRPASKRPKTAAEAAFKGAAFYQMLQCDDGHWAGDYGGPLFLMPGLIIVWYVMGKDDAVLQPWRRKLMLHYMRVHQQVDGGWGTHIESPSTMFGTCLNYVACRLLGMDADDAAAAKAQSFIRDNGGALYTASWAKFYLCVLGVMDWEGHNSVPPEMFLLPEWFPFHPARLWCHCRMVYLPMSYLYASRYVYADAETDPLVQSLRKELYYGSDYNSIPWTTTRNYVADMDNYSPIPTTMWLAQELLIVWEHWGGPVRGILRRMGLRFVLDYIRAEDKQTNFVDIGPVSKVLNMLIIHANEGSTSPAYRKHAARVPDYLWLAEDGMKMQGYNGSQCWDTSFFAQAIAEGGIAEAFPEMTKKMLGYFEQTQILSTPVARSSEAYAYEAPVERQRYFRHVSEGGWPFSTSAHGWPISDCTAEGLKAVLQLRNVEGCGDVAPIDDERLLKAVNVILTLQNPDGGWATYENNRGFGWYEQLNPSEVFGDIMIDYSYVECSSASMSALASFVAAYPDKMTYEIRHALKRGTTFIKSIQRDDGSWYGSWACCFTYGTWFGIEGLVAGGEDPKTSISIQKAAEFLLKHQNDNGGWGEDFTSCYNKSYAPNGMERYGNGGSGVVCTAWALLALMKAETSERNAVERGIRYLMRMQQDSGDWPQEGISGVFNRACSITYTAYRNVFPIWALARYNKFAASAKT